MRAVGLIVYRMFQRSQIYLINFWPLDIGVEVEVIMRVMIRATGFRAHRGLE